MTDDAELMRRSARGDDRAFEEIVSRHSGKLLNFFFRSGVSPSDSEDLAQRTFLKLWRYRERYSPTAKFTTFLFLLAHQEARDYYRAAGRRAVAEKGLEEELNAPSGGSGFGADAAERALLALRSLPAAQREVVELGVMQDMPYAEVAAVLNIPTGTVKSRMFAALGKLKEVLNGN